MSKHDKNVEVVDPACGGDPMAGLIIFILIILQFQKRNNCKRDDCKKDDCRHAENKHDQLFDNSTLFILVLYFVACCGKVRLGC
jgi:hypothetical protein